MLNFRGILPNAAFNLLISFKLVTHSPQRNYKFTVFAKTVAEHFDMSINSSIVAEEIITPHLFKKLIS